MRDCTIKSKCFTLVFLLKICAGWEKEVNKKNKKRIRVLSWGLFIVYLMCMVYFLFFSEQLGRGNSREYRYNLTVFAEIKRYITYWKKIGDFNVLLNLFGNVVCFMPFGFVLPILSNSQRSVLKVTFLTMLCSIAVEVIQLVTMTGSCDVDDVILNTAGGFLGYIMFAIGMCVIHIRDKKRKKQVVVTQKNIWK